MAPLKQYNVALHLDPTTLLKSRESSHKLAVLGKEDGRTPEASGTVGMRRTRLRSGQGGVSARHPEDRPVKS